MLGDILRTLDVQAFPATIGSIESGGLSANIWVRVIPRVASSILPAVPGLAPQARGSTARRTIESRLKIELSLTPGKQPEFWVDYVNDWASPEELSPFWTDVLGTFDPSGNYIHRGAWIAAHVLAAFPRKPLGVNFKTRVLEEGKGVQKGRGYRKFVTTFIALLLFMTRKTDRDQLYPGSVPTAVEFKNKQQHRRLSALYLEVLGFGRSRKGNPGCYNEPKDWDSADPLVWRDKWRSLKNEIALRNWPAFFAHFMSPELAVMFCKHHEIVY